MSKHYRETLYMTPANNIEINILTLKRSTLKRMIEEINKFYITTFTKL